ncbi:MAG: magnesium transporter [Proteobacteria bacterium]|nr:magnesium transporter [Pseudomonadota bacterium]
MADDRKIDSESLKSLLDAGDADKAGKTLLEEHPADIARFLGELGDEHLKSLFYVLDPKLASEVVAELNDEARDVILEDMESKRVGEIVDHMASDDAADLLGALSDEDARKVLDHLPADDSHQVKSLLAFEDDTAGGLMQMEIASVRSDASVQSVIDMLRANREDTEDIHNIFVVDANEQLTGVLPIRRLVLEPLETIISDIMDEDIISVHVDEDQEEVAKIFKKYDLLSLPVIDDFDRVVGRVTVDDIVDVMEEEASEDFFKMAGAGSDDILPKSILKSAKIRLPWLFASCLGGLVALKIIGAFEDTLGQMVVLVSFIPVILGMGGNIGTQSTTIVVRGLATGALEVGSLWRVVFKEIRIGVILGIVYGLFLGAAAYLIYPENAFLSLVVGLAMWTSMVLAAAVGTLMPIVLFRSGVDPAVATGPFVTTSVDIMGILILFGFATFFLL